MNPPFVDISQNWIKTNLMAKLFLTLSILQLFIFFLCLTVYFFNQAAFYYK